MKRFMQLTGLTIATILLFPRNIPLHGAETSQPANGGVFTQKNTPVTRIDWRGRTLIEKDTINYLEPRSFADTGKVQRASFDGWTVINTTSDAPTFQYRKEVGIRSDRVELTVQTHLPAYQEKSGIKGVRYSFFVPCKRLEGMKWKAMIGPAHKLTSATGQLTAETPDGPITPQRAYWIAFEGPEKDLVFNLNPKGLTTCNFYNGSSDLAGSWDVEKEGEYIRFSFSGSDLLLWGGVFTGKVVILETGRDAYMDYHSGNPYQYFYQIPETRNFIFGTDLKDNTCIAVNNVQYDAKNRFGWIKTDDLKSFAMPPASPAYSATASSEENTFICTLDRPGLYIVRVLASNITDKGSGPFSIWSNGELKAENLTIQPDKIKTVTFGQWLPAGEFRLTMNGHWLISGLSLQIMLHQEEDYAFNRGMWLIANAYEPSPVFSSVFYCKPPHYKVAVSEMDLPPARLMEPETIPTYDNLETALPDPGNPNLAWRFDCFVGGLGPNNNGTFLEFDTPEKITRRLKELKAKGVNVVMLNGYLARHCFREQLPRVQKIVKEIVRIGHSLDMKIMDHQELTILWYKESALRHMVENIDWCQRNVETDTLFQGWCPFNPERKKEYFAWMKQYINDTGIDGLMIDEVCYHSIMSCGCAHCRERFTKETGLVYPIGQNASLINNKSSLLHKAWMEWRGKEMGDWWLELRKEVLADRPDFCIMGYICDIGLWSDWDFQFGYDLFAMARGNDFVGTEIFLSNPIDNYRYVLANRRIFNLFRHEMGSPVFGLVYHWNNEYADYFGWAMNNMMGQATWNFAPIGDRKVTPNYLAWPENMNKQHAEELGDVAIIFSSRSRNFSPFDVPGKDALGISQTLTDHHIQHVFLTEKSLKSADKLQKYKLVVLPSTSCMSDAELQTIRDYVNRGGHVLLTGYTGLLDGHGTLRKRWGFADIMKCDLSADKTWPKETRLVTANGLSAIYPQPLMKIALQSETAKVMTDAIDQKGKVLGPAVVNCKAGKGTITYSAAQLGTVNFQRVFSPGSKWEYELNEPLARILIRTIREITVNQPLRFEAKQIPASVASSLWQQEIDGKRETLVHFLNASSVRMKKDETLPQEKTPPVFPTIDKDLVFEIELPSVTEAYATSPDYRGRKPVTVESLGEHRYRVTVPKEALQAYTMVVLR